MSQLGFLLVLFAMDVCRSTYAAPDNAHPECIPPTCCKTDVAASFTHTGAHYDDWSERLVIETREVHTPSPYMATMYKKRIHSSFLNKMAESRFPSTKAPRCSSPYLKRPHAVKMIPVRLSETTNTKNFLYVLNQRSKRIHRLIFDF